MILVRAWLKTQRTNETLGDVINRFAKMLVAKGFRKRSHDVFVTSPLETNEAAVQVLLGS